MKNTFLATLGLTTLLIAGCSSTPTKVDHGPIHARTFSFVAAPAGAPDFADNRKEVYSAIHSALSKTLSARGLTPAASGGDVTVAYLVIVGNNASTASVNDYFGYGRDASALQDKAQDAYSGSKSPNYFEAGTLVIDLIDAKTFKLLWRSHVTRQVMRDAADAARQANIQAAVEDALKGLRVAP